MTSDGLERELKAFLADHADTVVNAPFDPVMFEITDKDCNKGASIAWLGRHYGIEEDEIAVYGRWRQRPGHVASVPPFIRDG